MTKFFVSLNGRTSHKATKTALTLCSILLNDIFTRTYVYDIRLCACKLTPKLIEHHPDTKYIPKQ